MCNLNFNQCNGGPNYPRPIDTCGARLRSLLNSGTTTVINPIVAPNWAYANFVVPQDVWVGSVVGVRQQASSGTAINDNLDGSFVLSAGTYNIEYSANGIVPDSSDLSLALVLDGVVIEESRGTSSSSAGENSDISGRAIFSVGQSGSLLALVNVGTQNITLNRASLTINKIT